MSDINSLLSLKENNKIFFMATAKAPKKTAKKTPKTRAYDNTNRAAKSEQTEKSIIEALVKLLVERRGAEVPMEELAQKTGISQRTIFRFFKDKKTLHQAMDEYLFSFLQASGEQMATLDFVGFGKNAYLLFDKHESLTMAYVLSPFGQEARVLFRRKLNQAMVAKIVKEKNIELTPEKARRLALVTSLVNAKIWYDVKSDFGFSGKEMSDSVEWALNTLLENI
jgi:AcrR family transcriptional regulator